MIKNNKKLFLVTTLVLIFVSISALSAADNNDTSTLGSSIVEDNTVTDSVTTEDIQADVDKNTEKEINDDNTKVLKKATTHIVTNDNVEEIFGGENYTLADSIEDGDTLDFQGTIWIGTYNESSNTTVGHSLVINKPINVISSTADALISLNTIAGSLMGEDPGSSFIVNNGGSYSNISNLYLNNTQLWVTNAHYVTFDNMSMVVKDARVGSGVGQTAIRDNSSYVVMKNSFIYTQNNGGSSSFVLTYASHCTIENCTVQGSGTVGNLIYLNTYNPTITTEEGNCYNIIRNNTVIGPETAAAICYGLAVDGHDNLIEGNTFNYSGSGVTTAYSNNLYNNTVINNEFYGGCGINIKNATVTNNTVYDDGKSYISDGSTYTNNTFGQLTASSANATFENNTVLGLTTISKAMNLSNNNLSSVKITVANANLTNNNITGNVTATKKNILIANNNITGCVNVTYTYITVANNTIHTDSEYGIYVTKKYCNISGNYIKTPDLYGDSAISAVANNTISDNLPNVDELIPVSITVEDNTVDKGEITSITVNFNESVSDGRLTVKINDETVAVNIIESQTSTITISDIDTSNYDVGENTVTASYAISLYNDDADATGTLTLNGNSLGTSVIVVNPTTTSAYMDENIAITAVVSDSISGDVITDGTVSIDGTSYPIVDGSVVYNYTVTDEETKDITFTFDGNDNYEASESVTATVTKILIPTTTTVNDISGTVGVPVTITATVTNNADTTAIVNSGKVTFKYNNETIGETNLESDATATIEVTFNTTDSTNNVIAYYTDEENKYADSQSSGNTFEITKATTSITIDPTTTSAYKDETVTITATVKDANENVITDGTISIDGTSYPIIDGNVIYNYTVTNEETKDITFTYDGNDNYEASEAVTATVTKNLIPTTTSVDQTETTVGVPTTITANIIVADNNIDPTNVPQGSVVFTLSNGTQLGTTDVTDGKATISTTFENAMTETIIATYSDTEGKYDTSTSSSSEENLIVNKATTTITVDPTTTSAYVNETITITTTVKDENDNTITDGTISIDETPYPIIDGNVVYNYTVTNEEEVDITFTYDGNDNYEASEAVTATVTKILIPTTTTINDIDALVGQEVTLTASVVNNIDSSSVVDSGKVTFEYEGNVIGSATLQSDATASINVVFNHTDSTNSIIAYYSDDDNKYDDSESSENMVNIVKDNVTISVTATEVIIYNPTTITVSFNKKVTDGSITVKVNDEAVTTQLIEEETDIITLENVDTSSYDLGNNTISVEYAGSQMFDDAQATGILTISKKSVEITSDDLTLSGDSATTSITVNFNDTLTDGTVEIKVNDEVVYQSSISEETNSISVDVDTSSLSVGTNVVNVEYTGSESYDDSSCTSYIYMDKTPTTITVDPVSVSKTENTTITAKVTTNNSNIVVNGGKVVFKVNGKTLKDANGKIIYVKVVDGVATLSYDFTSMNMTGKTVTAVYSGTSAFIAARSDEVTVEYESTDVVISMESATASVGSTITLNATVKDTNENDVNNGKVIFKVNGKTLKDADGKIIYATVTDGVASIDYEIPTDMKIKDFTLTAIFTSTTYNKANTTATLSIIK